jgi:hypothetical protein
MMCAMPRICFNLTDLTAQKLKEVALKETGSMKGLSIVGEAAIKEYLEGRSPKRIRFVKSKSKEECQVLDVVHEGHTESV